MADINFKHSGPAADAPLTPSQQFIADAQQVSVVPDTKGRKISVLKPEFLAQFRFVEAIGPELARNDTWMRMVMPVLCVTAIGDEPVNRPRTKAEIEAVLKRLGTEGYDAVYAWMNEQEAGANSPAAAQAAHEDRVKNS